MALHLDRAAFLGTGVAAASVFDAAPAVADDPVMGHEHPPLIPEDDPGIMIARPKLASGVGSYAAWPKTITPTTPGVVITHAVWGLDRHTREVARRYARAGYIAIVPSIYDRLDAPVGDVITDISVFAPVQAKLFAAKSTTADLLAGHDWIKQQASRGKVGLTGFCMGGALAIVALIGAQTYDAASIFYGSVRPGENGKTPATEHSFDWTDRMTTPIMGSYAALDTGIAPDQVTVAYARMKARLGDAVDVKIYAGAKHAFFDDQRDAYNAAAATDGWNRTLAWFGKYLHA
jgi:carboxymethylenebutenolidase